MADTSHEPYATAEQHSQQYGAQHYGRPQGAADAALELFKEYARERPEIVTMWAFGLGFVLGWKLRIW